MEPCPQFSPDKDDPMQKSTKTKNLAFLWPENKKRALKKVGIHFSWVKYLRGELCCVPIALSYFSGYGKSHDYAKSKFY